MSRLNIPRDDYAKQVMDDLYASLDRRIAAAPHGNCPVDLTRAFLTLSLAQSCGKCVPCRIGLDRMAAMLNTLLESGGTQDDLDAILRAAHTIVESADCAIGFEAAQMVIDSYKAFRDDFETHAFQGKGNCTANFRSIPCVDLCPAHVDIPGYIALAGEGRCADAVRLIRKDNPFPSVCGLVCEHPCETHCRRNMVDYPLNIRAIKRYAVDEAGEVPVPACAEATGKTIAIVGGGPSGLTAAYFLSLMGHKCTVFEMNDKLGGMLRYGIPPYRLPAEYLDRDINAILSTGVDVKLNCAIGKDITIDELKSTYDCVYLAIGASIHKSLGIPGEDAENVLSAIQMLAKVDVPDNPNKPDFTGKRVVVVGGGNVAMDASRTAVRLGAASVNCVYRRRIADMTALPEEIEGAMAEGVEVEPLKAPVRIETDENGKVLGLVIQPQIIGEVRGGRPSPKKADKPEELIPCDIVLMAVGQAVDSGDFAKSGVPTKWDNVVTEDDGSVEGMENVFSGGDCVFGPATVILAIAAGKVAAANIDNYLGYHTEISVDVEIPAASSHYTRACGRVDTTERASDVRKHDFDLMEKGMSHQEAKQECGRCLRCDHYGYAGIRGGRVEKW